MAVTAGGRVAIDDGLRRRLTVLSIGFAVISSVVFLLGLVDVFHRWTLIAVAAAGATLALPFLPREVAPARAAWRRADRSRRLVVATAAIVLVDVILSAAPPTSGDAIAYHLSAPKLWLEAGRIFPVWWSWQSFQPFSAEMHFALALALEGGRAAMVVGSLFAAFSAACVYGLARALAGTHVAAVAALLWVGQGVFVWEATGGFVELLLAGFVALAAWHVVALRETGRAGDAAWAGLSAGLAAAVKYHGLVFLPVLAVLALLAIGRGRRILALAAFAALACIALPWYVRNWIVTGNPAYPFLADVFGGRYLDAATRYDLDQSLAGTGIPGIARLPIFPLEFLLHTDRYERGYSFSPALFALPLVAVAVGTRMLRLIALGIVVYLVVWWEEMQQVTRYLLPVLPFAAVLAGWAAAWLWEQRTPGRRVLLTLAAVTAIPLVAITGLFAWRTAPGALGLEREGRYVQRLTGTYDAFRWLDTRLPPDGRVLVGIRDLYWLDRPYAAYDITLFNFGQPTQQAVARMRRYDVRYLAFLNGGLPTPLQPLRPRLERLARLDVPLVTSRTLGRTSHEQLDVWAWCDARGDPCKRTAG